MGRDRKYSSSMKECFLLYSLDKTNPVLLNEEEHAPTFKHYSYIHIYGFLSGLAPLCWMLGKYRVNSLIWLRSRDRGVLSAQGRPTAVRCWNEARAWGTNLMSTKDFLGPLCLRRLGWVWRLSSAAVCRKCQRGKRSCSPCWRTKSVTAAHFITQLCKELIVSALAQQEKPEEVVSGHCKVATALPEGSYVLGWRITKISLLCGAQHTYATHSYIRINQRHWNCLLLTAINTCTSWHCCAMFPPKHKTKMNLSGRSKTKT